MNPANAKIGHLIAQIRQERLLTQAEFAKKLSTSQSAINRIEHGRQNLSIETLARISDVLNKQLISISGEGVNLRIEGGQELSGEITLKTSKNAAVSLLCASLLNYGVTRFKSFPRIEEVYRIIEVLESIGVSVKWLANNDLEIKRPLKLNLDNINKESAKKTRSVLMLLGPLMHEFKEFKIPFAGGCKLGRRTINPHLYALEELGVSIVTKNDNYNVSINKKIADRIILYERGDTATVNTLLACSRFNHQTIIEFGSSNYAIQDTSLFLQKLGIKINNIGQTTFSVQGIKEPIKKNITYSPCEDPVEAMFFISSAICTKSHITIKRVPIDFLSMELLRLQKMGLVYKQSPRYKAENGFMDLVDLEIFKSEDLRALEDGIHSQPYPGLNADNLPYFVPIACLAKGRTLIHDWMYDNRAIYYTELTKIGAQIELADPHRVYITGPTSFKPADLVCPPALRPASLLLIGMLAAHGISMLRDVYTINRGYEDLAERLNTLGAKISVLHDA